MATQIFVNLPVNDLQKSIEFFTKLGYSFNPEYTDETATSMIVSEDIFVMLMIATRFQGFTRKGLCDASKDSEVILSLSLDSRAEVDEMVRKAIAAGGKTYNDPLDYGFMYSHGYQDLDGHLWEVFYMDPSAPK